MYFEKQGSVNTTQSHGKMEYFGEMRDATDKNTVPYMYAYVDIEISSVWNWPTQINTPLIKKSSDFSYETDGDKKKTCSKSNSL